MVIDSLDRRKAKTLALLNSPESERIYKRNKYDFGLDHRNNICGLIEKICGRLKWENLIAVVYDRVEAELSVRKAERMAG